MHISTGFRYCLTAFLLGGGGSHVRGRFVAASTIIEKFFQRQLCKEGLQSILDKKMRFVTYSETVWTGFRCLGGALLFAGGKVMSRTS